MEHDIRSLYGRPFVGRASNWLSNKLGCYITMYSPIARSVVLRRRNRIIIDLLYNVFIHNAARSRLSPQMAEPCKERIPVWFCCHNNPGLLQNNFKKKKKSEFGHLTTSVRERVWSSGHGGKVQDSGSLNCEFNLRCRQCVCILGQDT